MSGCKRGAGAESALCRRKPPRLILLDAGALLAYLILAIAFTRPLWATLTDGIIGRIGDNIYFIWLVGWFKKAYFSLGVDPMNVWFLNYPAGWSLASTEIAPAQLAIAVPFALPGGETFGYNAALLISFALSGWFCYHWVASLTGSRRAGFLSGVIFACLPYRQAHFLAGHLNLSGTQWLPLFFWGWFEILRADRADGRAALWPALLAALGLGLTALCSQYYAFMLIFLSGSLMILTLVLRDRKRFRSAAFWKTLAAFVVFSLPLLIVAEAPFLTLNASGALPDRDLSAVRQYSASVSDFFLPATTHFAWGGRVGSVFRRDLWIESTLYLGVAALALFFVGLTLRRRPGGERTRWLWFLLSAGVLLSALLAMGTDLHWNERPVELPLPSALAERLGRGSLPLLLPGYFLFRFVPFYAKIRATMRFGLFTGLFVAVGAGLGAARLLGRTRRRYGTALFLGLVLICVLDFYPKSFPERAEIAPRPVDLWLAGEAGSGAVMRLPFALNDDQAATYATLIHGKPFVGGFFNAFPTAQYRKIRPVMETFPSMEALQLAKELGVGYFILESDDALPEAERAAVQAAAGERAETLGLIRLYQDADVIVMGFQEDE